MAKLETDLNRSPYFDDYVDVAEGKNYHRVLFKPGLAVQTRELNTLQAMLQEQVSRFGDNIFKEGTIIDGCSFQYDDGVKFVKLRDRDPGGNTVTASVFANGIVQGLTSGVRAKVVATAAGTEAGAPNTNTLLVKYLNGGTSKTAKTFSAGETLSFLAADGGAGQQANTLNSGAFGNGSVFSVGEGVIYGKGHFVNVDPQTIILEKYNTSPSYKVGFKVSESTVDSDTDDTLLDNARGSYNYTAPGADRLKLTSTLTKKELTFSSNTESFVPIFEVDAGNIRTIKSRSIYNELGDQMAERTYDESGNYEIKKMQVAVKEHYDTGSNFGRWAPSSTNPVANTQRLAIGVEPGEAYVQGYHNEHLATVWIDADKGIDTKEQLAVDVNVNYANYVDCANVVGRFDATNYAKVSLRSANAAVSGHNDTFGAESAPGAELGTARIKYWDYISGTPGQNNAVYRFYLFDVEMANGSFTDVKSLHTNDGVTSGFANIRTSDNKAALTEPSFNRGVFQSGISAVKQWKNAGGTVNAQYRYRAAENATIQTNGQQTVTVAAGHSSGQEELAYGTGALTNAQKQSIILVNGATVAKANIGTSAIFPGDNSKTVFISGSPAPTNLVAGDLIEISNTSSTQVREVASVAGTRINVTTAITVANTGGSLAAKRVYPAGYIFDLTGKGLGGNRSVTVNSSTQFAINLNETFNSTFATRVFFNKDRELGPPANKIVRKNRFVKINLSGNPGGTAGPWSLGLPDVFNIRKVYLGTTYSTSNRNVTSDFSLVVNATDAVYKNSKIAIRPNSILNLKTTDRLLVELDYFHHDRTSGIGFFNVDSYPIDPNESTSNTTAIVTGQIPLYSSQISNEVFDLRDSIDFRPRYRPTAADATTVGAATEDPVSSNTTSTYDIQASGSYVPTPNLLWESDVVRYLPRVDRVVIGKDGKKRVVKGISDDNPFPPPKPAESMSLALLTIPPFPSLSQQNARNFGVGRLNYAVTMWPIYNRRYRMKDIAAIDKRVGNLEYYMSLSLLEKAASDLQITDAAGLNRFKNGIFVDQFHGHDNADTTNIAYSIAIDGKKGEIRPKFEQFNVDLELLNVNANVARKGKHKRIDITNANAYTVGATITAASGGQGTVRAAVLTGGNPAASTGQYRLYLHNTNTGTFAVNDNISGGGGGKVSAVQDATTTDALMMSYTHSSYIRQQWATNLINPVGELLFEWTGEITLTPEADHWKDVTTLPEVSFEIDLASPFEDFVNAQGTNWGDWNTTQTVDRDVSVEIGEWNLTGRNAWQAWRNEIRTTTTTTTTTDTREGIRVNVDPFESTQSAGSFVTDVGTVPFIRSRRITFVATGMRPDTRVYPFFEDVAVSSFVRPHTEAGVIGNAGEAIITDSNGIARGDFLIPNDDSLKFRVGERTFKLIDIQDLVVEAGTSTTIATAKYNASGLTVSERGLSVSTREPVITTVPVTEVVTDVTTTSSIDIDRRWRDPVAQSFVVGEFEYSDPSTSQDAAGLSNNLGIGADGIFVSAIDLFFERKPGTNSNSGIAVEIREMINGQITNIRVPLGNKRIEKADVNVSSDGQAVTPFYFDAPVYLRGGKEYAFIVKPDGNDPGYRLWTARLGGNDVSSNAVVDQQPAAGMLFTSANDRTYSPRQNEDVKFEIWRSSFSTNVNGVVNMVNQADEYLRATQISGAFQIDERVIGESLIKLSANTGLPAVGDTVQHGTATATFNNSGVVRQIVSNTAGAFTFRADVPNPEDIAASQTLTFKRKGALGKTYTGTVHGTNGIKVSSANGAVQYYNGTTGDFIIDSSGGAFEANTTPNNGFFRGETSNNVAQVYDVRDLKYNVVAPRLSIAQYVDTNVSVGIKTTSNANAIDSSFTSIRSDSDFTFIDAEKIVAGATKTANTHSGNKTLSLQTTMSTNNDRVSPIFDLGRAKSLVLVKNIVNNTANNEFGNYGKANAKYISKKVVLADGQDAEDIRVILDAYKPAGTDVQVWVRVQNEYDEEDYEDKHYTKLTSATTEKRDSSITDLEDFVEMEFNFPTSNDSTTQFSAFANTNNSSIVEYRSREGKARFTTYKYYSVKVVLTSSGSHLVPRVRGLRAIALQR